MELMDGMLSEISHMEKENIMQFHLYVKDKQNKQTKQNKNIRVKRWVPYRMMEVLGILNKMGQFYGVKCKLDLL